MRWRKGTCSVEATLLCMGLLLASWLLAMVLAALTRKAQNEQHQQDNRRENEQPSNDIAETIADAVRVNNRILRSDRMHGYGMKRRDLRRPSRRIPLLSGELSINEPSSWQSCRDVMATTRRDTGAESADPEREADTAFAEVQIQRSESDSLSKDETHAREPCEAVEN